MTVLEVKPHPGAGKFLKRQASRPSVFPEKRQAIDYTETRACFRSGEIQVLDSSGAIERINPP
jgi:hypothetical protein